MTRMRRKAKMAKKIVVRVTLIVKMVVIVIQSQLIIILVQKYT